LEQLEAKRIKTNQAAVVANAAQKAGFQMSQQTQNQQADQTEAEWMAKAPPSIQSAVRNAMQIERNEKAGLIQKITANSRNKFTQEQLVAKPLDELRLLAELATEQTEQPLQVYPNYAGQAAPMGNQQASTQEERRKNALVPPTTNWKEFAKASA
jgi:hypothetical protein